MSLKGSGLSYFINSKPESGMSEAFDIEYSPLRININNKFWTHVHSWSLSQKTFLFFFVECDDWNFDSEELSC